jgi:hypothetical protein
VRSALQRFTAASSRIPEGSPIATLLGTQLRTNFEVLDSARAHSPTLAGRHRFTRYMLTFELNDDAEAATHLPSQTCAERQHPTVTYFCAMSWLSPGPGGSSVAVSSVSGW